MKNDMTMTDTTRNDEATLRRPLLEPSDGTEGAGRIQRPRSGATFKKNLGAVEAFGIIISVVIGSGVFTSPGAIDTNVPSPGLALVVWLVGGVLAWTGGITFAELGTAIEGEGGVQGYLQYIYGDVAGFLAAWTWIVAIMPATLAILSIACVEVAFSAAGITGNATHLSHKGLSIVVLCAMSLANSISTKASTRLNNFFVVIKFATIFAVVIAGLAVVIKREKGTGGDDWMRRNWFGWRDTVSPDGDKTVWEKLSTWELLGHLSEALYAALWGYSGWDKAVYVSAELSKPEKQLPLAINGALSTTIVAFLVANAAFYVLLPWDTVSTTDSVAVTAITRLLGRGFGIVAAIFICVVVAGSLLGNSFVASRMTVAAANKSWMPALFAVTGRIGSADEDTEHPDDESKVKSDAPINSLVLSALLAALYILFGSFRALLTLNGLGEYSFFFLAVVGSLILRWREPELRRPYKAFILCPVVFIIVSGFVVVRGAAFSPAQALIIVGIWAIGLAYYWIRQRWSLYADYRP